jgi:CheY-like chemotaxis protein
MNGGVREEKRILIVDDDDAIRALLFTLFRRRGLDVDTACNGREAVDRCMRCDYALILLDLMMPLMNGWEVLERLKELADRPAHPLVIVLSAGVDPVNLDSRVVVGALRKPFDVPVLLDMVTACLSTIQPIRQPGSCPLPDSRLSRTTGAPPREESN